MVQKILLNFNELRRGDAGGYAELYEKLVEVGYGIFYLESKIAVWLIMCAFLITAYAMTMRSGTLQGRKELKEKIKRTIIVAFLLLNIVSFVGCTLKVGMDMF